MGPPGSGKGTQAKLLASRYGIIHLAPGDMFRQEVKSGTDLGKVVGEVMARGELVSDDITVRIMDKKLKSGETGRGFVLDGFPRNIAQAEALDRMLAKMGARLDLVLNLAVSEEEILARTQARRTCSRCGRPYNLKASPPAVAGRCDVCGGELILRPDDKDEVVSERMRVYRHLTEPVIEHYEKQGLVVSVDGARDIDGVTQELVSIIDARRVTG